MLDLIPEVFSARFSIIADMTLLMVGFLLGGRLTRDLLKETASEVFWISICAALTTAGLVSLGLIFAGVPREVAIILGCIASATAPAAILDVVMEHGVESKFSRLLLSIVALDDLWSLILFGVGVSAVKTLNGASGEISFLWIATREIGGAVLLGIALGLPAAYLTGRVKKGQPVLSEALGLVFVCGGLAIWLGFSYLIASMVMGAVIANMARHHEYPFHAIEGIEWPFMVIFFVLAGASLDLESLAGIGLIGSLYIVCRALGKWLGARVGSELSRTDRMTKNWMGFALLPQAGVAIGMALVASNQFPAYQQVLLSIVISSTVVFEIAGPVFTSLALKRTLDH